MNSMKSVSYPEKVDRLLEHFRYATKLAEALGVHRMSIQNWRDGSVEVSEENRVKIDVLYAKHCIIPSLGDEVYAEAMRLEAENHAPFLDNLDVVGEISKWSAFGSLEVEVSGVNEESFVQAVEGEKIEKDMDRRKFLEANNLAFLTKQAFAEVRKRGVFSPDAQTIKHWHAMLMNGIREDAGRYSTKMRIIPGADLTLTDPRDIEDEMDRWVKRYKRVNSIEAAAAAHAHFELIHPFGDGNGRIGRLILACQFLEMNLLPPMIDRHNKTMYYASLEKTQKSGDTRPLLYLLVSSVERMKQKIGLCRSAPPQKMRL